MDNYVLSNGVAIPVIGFGTWKIPADDASAELVAEAIRCGYRHIDTAEMYDNEQMVGKAIRQSGIDRSKLFITSKLANSVRTYEETLKAAHESLEKLGTDYLDLFLIHWPAPKGFRDDYVNRNLGIWKAFEELYNDGKVRSIGVSNFLIHHLENLLPHVNVRPMVNQIELHPFNYDSKTIDYCRQQGMLIEAFSPLARGRIIGNELIKEVGEKYGKNVAQVCVRWILQKGALPLPKTTKKERLAENIDVFDFVLSEEDMNRIDSLIKEDGRIISHPDHANY